MMLEVVLWWTVGLAHGLIWRDSLLALFRRLFRKPKPDGVRAPEAENKPLLVDGRWLVIRIPLPPEDALLNMLYQSRERQIPLGMVFNVDFDGDFCEEMLTAQRAATPGPRETQKADK